VYEREVTRGVAVMDHHDARWRDRVDADELDVHSSSLCVVGQYFTAAEVTTRLSFDARCVLLGAPDEPDALTEWVFDHGFDARDGDYDALTAAWRAHLGPTETEED
jgi:hypothetical protein